jgi:glycosyltransferase involved in cell wall biosynthesis
MKFLIVLPVINELITDECIRHIDPKYYENIVLIDNSRDGFAQKYGAKLDYERFDDNIGVARSWNMAARDVIEGKMDYLIIMSASVLFQDGGMDKLVELLEENDNPWGMETQLGWHLICLSRQTLSRVGLFDENFYPAYFEESDYIRRMEILGIHNPMSSTKRLPKVSVPARSQGDALAVKSGTAVNFVALEEYFIKKWGGKPLYESEEYRHSLYKTPFNDPDNAIDYWAAPSIKELKRNYAI